MTHHLPSSYLPSPPLSTPTVTKQLQFPQTRPRPSYLLPFPTTTSLPLNKLNFTSKLPPTPSSESLADPSSDPSSSPSTTSPDFNQTILTHLKPPGPLASSSSSFSPFFPPTAHRAQEIPRARNISFSATPLGSLNASPRHRPYSTSSTRRRVPSTSIYSHPSFDLLPPLTDLSNSTPAARSRRRAEKKPLPLVQPDEDDVPTDDEADEDAVEHLLLSQEQLAVSPLRIQAFSLPFPDRTPRGILKKWHHPILKVTNALEGCKRNGGRRKHTLSFCDAEGVKNAPPPPPKDARNCVTAVAVQELAESGGKSDSAGGSGEETGGKEGGRKTRGDATRSGAAGKVGGGNASDHRDDERRAGGLPACVPKFVDLRDDDPIHLRTPLITLRASLRNLRRRTANDDQGSPGLATRSTTSTRRASHLHASMRRSPTGPPSRPNFDDLEDVVDDDPANATDAPTTLHEVDTAYIALVRALIRLPTTLVDEAATLQPLREFRVSLLRCLERDLSNILSFPSATRPSSMSRDLAILHGAASSSGSSSSSPAREDGTSRARTGLSDAEMRRQKDEVGAAQAAIKCAAALVQLHRFSSIFSPQELSTLLSIILRIPGSPGLSSSVHKDIYPFISWFLHMQRLSLSLLDPHLPRILSVIRTTLTNPDKPRHNLVEGISAIGRFLLTHPEATLMQSDKWLWIVVEGLWEVPRKGMAVRIRAGATLGAVVRALVTKWDSKAEEEQAEEEKEKRDALAIDISNTFNALLKRATHDPDYPTCLQQLFNQLANALRTDEAPWAVNIIALIPALLKHNFRRLETAGVRPWVSLVSQVRSHSSLHLRALGNLLWNHLIFAFLNTSHTNPLTAGTLSWSFGEGRLSVLTGVFQTQRSVWSEYDRVSQVQREKATVLAQVLAGAVYGLSVLNRDLPPSLVVDSEAPATVDPQLEQYDILWARLVMGGWIKDVQRGTNVVEVVEGEGRRKFTGDDVLAAILSRYEETAIIGWSILAAIVKPPSEATQSAGLEALINLVFLDGSVAKTKVPTAQALLIARALAKAPQPVAIPGWSTRWTVANAEKVLEMVDKCLGGERRADLSELCVAPFWRNFMLAFAAEPENPALEPGVLAILEWLIRLPTLAFFGAASASPLARLLITTTFDVLGDHLLRLPLDAEGAHPFLRLATAFFTTSTMAAQEATRFEPLATKMLQSALALSEKPLPLLASATSSFAIRLLDQPPSDLLPLLVSQWTNALANPDVQLVVAELESLVKLLRSYQRDPTAGEAWQELAKSALVAVFDRSDSSAAMSGSFVELLGRAELCGDHHLEHLLLSVSAEQPASTQGVISNLASNALCSLAKDISRNGDLVANMLEIAPDRFLIPLYKAVLLTLKSVVTPTSRELEAAIPLLAPCLTRALDHVHLCGDAVLVFHEFWIATFANVALEFDLPDDFADLLGIIRSATLEGRLANVGETQCEPQASTLPPPGQRSPATRPDDSATSLSRCEVVEQSGREYEADVSMALDSTRTSIPASYRVPISSSLRVPDPSVDVNPSPVEEELATPQIDETPPDEQVKASLPSQQRRTSAKRSRSPSPSQQPPKSTELIACSSSIIIDGSDDEDSVVAPARGGRSQARSSSTDTGSQGSSKNKSKRAKSAAVVPPTASTSKAARGEKRKVKSGPSFEVEVEVKRRPKGDTTSSHKRVSPVEPVAGPSSKRRRTLKGSIDVDSNDDSHVATPSPVEEQADVFRRLLTRSPDGAAEEVERLGSPLLRRLKMLGERATAQFLKRGTK